MGKITLDAVVYDGKEFGDEPKGDAALLVEMGFRQNAVFDPYYDSVLTLDAPAPSKGQVKPGMTIVHDDGSYVCCFDGDRRDKAPAKKAAKAAKKK